MIKLMPHKKYLKEIEKKGSILVCMPKEKSFFKDDMKGKCSICGREIVFRPYNKNANKKICIECAERIVKEV
jgi:hypothetical protein